MAVLSLSIRKIDITPSSPVSLLGYFNRRISTGVSDPLHCRIARLRLEGRASELLFIGIDTCFVPKADADRIKAGIEKMSGIPPEHVMIFATHTHTAPALGGFFETEREKGYFEELEGKILQTISSLGAESGVSVRVGSVAHQGLSYNRRWYMKNGGVVTNPPRLSPLRERPEGPADREVRTVGFFGWSGEPRALFVNISNHTDTIGGTQISADWPGFMERSLNRALKKEYPGLVENVPVFAFIAPQGNINHIDFDSPKNQTDYGEAERLGEAYAELVCDSLPRMQEVSVNSLASRYREVRVPPREISETLLEQARSRVSRSVQAEPGKDLTSEDIVNDNPYVKRLFAKELLDFHRSRPGFYSLPLQVLEVGPVSFCGIPGEPFVEMGLALKKLNNRRFIIPVALANGYFGYIPLEECFDRGGYEVRPGGSNCLSRTTATIILREIKNLLE